MTDGRGTTQADTVATMTIGVGIMVTRTPDKVLDIDSSHNGMISIIRGGSSMQDHGPKTGDPVPEILM